MERYRWDGYINLGDFLDFNELSKFSEGYQVEERVAQTFEAGRAILDRHRRCLRALNPKCRMILIEGNHDYRVKDYAARHPEMDGFLDVEKNLDLKGMKIEWHPTWTTKMPVRIGKAGFLHGNKGGQYHAKVMVQNYCENVFYGHTHDVMEIPLVRAGHDNVVIGKSLGCLCEYDQRYLKGNPTKWQQSFSVFYFQPDGHFNEFNTKIFKHTFVSPEGDVYGE